MSNIKFEEIKFEKILIDWKGKGSKQIPLFPGEKNQIIRIPFQKETGSSEKIIFDKILQKDEEFGQPYLPIKLIGEVIKHGKNKKIHGMKYKAKKRTKRTWGHQEQYTLIKIVEMESN